MKPLLFLALDKLNPDCEIFDYQIAKEFKSPFFKISIIVTQLSLKLFSIKNELLKYLEKVKDKEAQIPA